MPLQICEKDRPETDTLWLLQTGLMVTTKKKKTGNDGLRARRVVRELPLAAQPSAAETAGRAAWSGAFFFFRWMRLEKKLLEDRICSAGAMLLSKN